MDPYDIIYHPYVTEKTMNLMEKSNALEFVVKRKASKNQIRDAVEEMLQKMGNMLLSHSHQSLKLKILV